MTWPCFSPSTTHCNTLCNTLQHIVILCNTLRHTATNAATQVALFGSNNVALIQSFNHTLQHTLQHTATRCNALQHIVMFCNTVQHIATNAATQVAPFESNDVALFQSFNHTLQHTATHCNALQHTTTHCNKRCNTGSAF